MAPLSVTARSCGGSPPAGRQEHTLLVAAASLVPKLGAAAYMLSKPLRTHRAIAVIAFDRTMQDARAAVRAAASVAVHGLARAHRS